jgi:hypothetical protein
MAREIVVKFVADTKEFNKALDESKRKLESAAGGGAKEFGGMRSAISASTAALAAFGVAGVAAFRQIGSAALDAAIKIDKQVSTLRALTGSAEAATKRFQELFKIAQATPGLTTSLALTLDTQLRIFNVSQRTINSLLPVIGRLNAISPLGDPKQFVNNLTQLISQNFERSDLKELVGQSPIAGNLIKQIFNVDNPTNAEAIRAAAKRMGVTTVERLAEELVKAGENNSALKNAVETLGGQFDKLQDRLDVALAPLGRELATTLIPIFEDLVKFTEQAGKTAAEVFRDSKTEIIAVARELGNVTIQLGNIISKVAQLAAPGGFQEIMRETALMLATIGDITSGDFGGTRTRKLAEQFFNEDVRADQQAAAARRLPAGVSLNSALGLLKNPTVPPPPRPRPGGLLGGGGARRRGITQAGGRASDFGLNDAELLAHEAELARIRQSNLAVVLRRQAPPEGIGLPTLPLTARGAPGIEGFPVEGIRELERAAANLERLPNILSNSERFMRGFAAATETVGDAFDRFGANVAHAFTNIRTLFDGLKQSVLGFFNDLIGTGLQNLVRQTLGPLFGGGGGGNIFRTPNFAGGGGISVPASISQGIFGFGQGFGIQPLGAGGAGGPTGIFANGQFAAGLAGGRSGGILGGVFNKIFGGGAVSALPPLLGAQLGAGFGGTSTAGNILGAIGGGAIGLGASFGASVFAAAGGGLGALGPAALAALGPIGLIGAPLLVGAILLGKASQRKKDEEAAGQMLVQAQQQIVQLKDAIAADQIDGAQARQIFDTQILAQFRAGINTLKTASVRESRLTNQVRDLEKVYSDLVLPQIAAQEARRKAIADTSAADAAAAAAKQARLQAASLIFSKQIPEFAAGGTTLGGLALLHPGEKVLNMQQQSAVRAMAGPGVFERAGVPGVQHSRVFDNGGVMPAGGGMGPIEITLEANVVISEKMATGIYITGGKTAQGRAVTVNNVKIARTNREL